MAAYHTWNFTWYLQHPLLPSHLPRALKTPVQLHTCGAQHRQLCYCHSKSAWLEMGKGTSSRKGRLPPTEGLLELWAQPLKLRVEHHTVLGKEMAYKGCHFYI